ncbi:hypothetical protein K7X08_032323 [Anisodus acutangulus]|uniref:Uncharacterized protein n=1 Tax=Anisodus acutangulus TaxID=402998 RepID=A0A9Q1M3R8_9SOLA|nr:hypothetical protein K7X08_032323 [Anisodus acutangulus]
MGQSNEFPHQPRHTRWDKVQGKKEKERIIEKAEKQLENLNIRRTRSNTQQSYNSEEKELQREVLELGVKAKAPKELINKRRKFSKEVTIPEDVVLVGESREANSNIRKEGRNHGNTWTPLNLKKRKGFNVDNPKERRGENLDPGLRNENSTKSYDEGMGRNINMEHHDRLYTPSNPVNKIYHFKQPVTKEPSKPWR